MGGGGGVEWVGAWEGVAQVKCADTTRLHVLNEADLREGSGEFTLFAKKTNHAAISCL